MKKALLILFILSGCNGGREWQQTQETAAVVVVPVSDSVSTLSIPLDFPVSELSKMINEHLPEVLMDDTIDLKKEDYLKLTIRPSGKMLFNAYGTNLDVSLPMNVSVLISKKVIGIKMKNKEPLEFHLRVDMNSKLAISEDWKFNPQCKIQRIQWITPPEKKVLGINVNLSSLIEKTIMKNSSTIETAISKVLSNMVPVGKQVEVIWTLMNETHRVAKNPVDIWLMNDVSQFSADFANDTKDTLRVDVKVMTDLVVSPLLDADKAKRPMPVNKAIEVPDGLNIKAQINVPYKYLEEILDEKLGAQDFEYQGLVLKFDSCRVSTNEARLELRLKVSGDVEANLVALFYPTLDSMKNLVISDINYKMESESSLLKITDWAINKPLTQYLENKSRVPLADFLDSLDYKIVNVFQKTKVSSKMDVRLAFQRIESDTLLLKEEGMLWFMDVYGRGEARLKSNLIE